MTLLLITINLGGEIPGCEIVESISFAATITTPAIALSLSDSLSVRRERQAAEAGEFAGDKFIS